MLRFTTGVCAASCPDSVPGRVPRGEEAAVCQDERTSGGSRQEKPDIGSTRETASGVKYHTLKSFAVVMQSGGDVRSRMLQLVDEVTVSLAMISELIESCVEQLGENVNVLLPKVVRVPEGTYEQSIETPLGIASWFLVSRNDKLPYRLKLRPASLHTVLALPTVLQNSKRCDFDAIIASMPFLSGDADR